MEKTVVLKSLGKNLQFRLPKSSIKNKKILSQLETEKNDIIDELELPVKVITKLVMQLKLSNGSIFEAPKPMDPLKPFENVANSSVSLLKEILKDEVYVKSMINLYEKYELQSIKEFVGFLLAVFLKDKSVEEVNAFFGLEEKLKEEEVIEIKAIMDILEVNL